MRSLGNLWQSDAEHWQSPDREPSRTDRPGRAALLASETTQTETAKARGPQLPTQLADRPGLVVTSGPKVTLRNAFHINELFGTFWDRGKLGGQVEMSRFLSGPMDVVARQAKSAKS